MFPVWKRRSVFFQNKYFLQARKNKKNYVCACVCVCVCVCVSVCVCVWGGESGGGGMGYEV